MPALTPRIDFPEFMKQAPEAVAALRTLTKVVNDAGLEKALTELVKVRVSQINGCAFCIQFHLNLARELGVPAPKLDLVAAWRDAGVFTDREAAALAWAEALTRVAAGHAGEADWQALREHFSETEAMHLTIAIGTINQWNRIAIALQFVPPVPKGAAA